LREYALIDPATRQVEVFTMTQAGAGLLPGQSKAATLTLDSMGLERPMTAVFKGVESDRS